MGQFAAVVELYKQTNEGSRNVIFFPYDFPIQQRMAKQVLFLHKRIMIENWKMTASNCKFEIRTLNLNFPSPIIFGQVWPKMKARFVFFYPRFRFGQVLLKTVVRFGFSTLDYLLIKFYWKWWSDSDSVPSITFWWILLKVVVRFEISTFDHSLIKFYWKTQIPKPNIFGSVLGFGTCAVLMHTRENFQLSFL